MTFSSPEESWAYQLRHSVALETSEHVWPGAREYRQLVAELAASPFAASLYALRSHDSLRISATPGWVSVGPKWVDRPSVLVRPKPGGRVALSRHGGATEQAQEAECDPATAITTLLPWLASLATSDE